MTALDAILSSPDALVAKRAEDACLSRARDFFSARAIARALQENAWTLEDEIRLLKAMITSPDSKPVDIRAAMAQLRDITRQGLEADRLLESSSKPSASTTIIITDTVEFHAMARDMQAIPDTTPDPEPPHALPPSPDISDEDPQDPPGVGDQAPAPLEQPPFFGVSGDRPPDLAPISRLSTPDRGSNVRLALEP